MNKRIKIVQYQDIGAVRYVKNRRAKHLSIRINQQGETRVTIPAYVSMQRAEAFVMTRKPWVQTKLSQIRREAGRMRKPLAGEILSIRGKEVQISLQKGEQSGEEALWRILLQEAKQHLPERVNYLAKTHGLNYSGLKIRRMKSRWGSCTAKNSINLNSWLMMLPEHLSDYVILHELVHTLHRDHSVKFWEALDRYTFGRSRELRNELKTKRIMHLPFDQSDQ